MVVFILMGLYLSIAPTELTSANYGADGGDFLAAILTNGIPHPTGYPTYILLGQLFQQIPLGTPYFRGALLSMVPMAFACGLLALWIGFLFPYSPRITPFVILITGLGAGTAPLLFSQAVIVEVHGLQALFLMCAIWWATLLWLPERNGKQKVLGYLLALVYGVGLGNHLILLLMSPALLFAGIHSFRLGMPRKLLGGQIILVLVGLLVYLYLPFSARSYPPINWGNPQTWEGFRWLISGQSYQNLLLHVDTTLFIQRVSAWSRLLIDQFGVIGLLLGLVGITQASLKKPAFLFLELWVFAAYSLFAIFYQTQDSVVYMIPAYMIFATWVAYSIYFFVSVGRKWQSAGLVLGIFLLLYLVVRIPVTRTQIDPRQNVQPATYAETILNASPPGALILTKSDGDTFPLWYYHFGLKRRPDIRVVVLPLTQFSWYLETLQHIYPDLIYPSEKGEGEGLDSWREEFLFLNSKYPVCYTDLDENEPSGISINCSNP